MNCSDDCRRDFDSGSEVVWNIVSQLWTEAKAGVVIPCWLVERAGSELAICFVDLKPGKYLVAQTPHTPNLSSFAMLRGEACAASEVSLTKKMVLMMGKERATKRRRRNAVKSSPQDMSATLGYRANGLSSGLMVRGQELGWPFETNYDATLYLFDTNFFYPCCNEPGSVFLVFVNSHWLCTCSR